MTPRRILHCIPEMGGGGAQRQVSYLAGEFGRLGWEVHVATRSVGPNLDRLEGSGARVHEIADRRQCDPRVVGQLVRTMRRVKPDLVQVWLVEMDILGGLAANALGLPWISSERSSSLSYPPSVKHWLRVRVAAGAAAVVSNSAAGDAYWRGRVNGHVARYVVPNALPLAEIDSAPRAHPDETGVECGQRMVLFAGRLSREKNVDVLLAALRVVLAEPNTLAVLCGEGPLRAAVERRLTDWAIRDRVRLPGYVKDVWRFMKRADVVVAPSLWEGQPNAVLEAMACGCPLVVSDIPAHREILDETTAALVNPRDPDALARAILDTLSSPEAARARVLRARPWVSALSIPAVSRRYADVYESVLAARQREGSRA